MVSLPVMGAKSYLQTDESMGTDYDVSFSALGLIAERINGVAIHRQLSMCMRMRALRLHAGLTQADVAERLGVSQAAYSRLEKGEVEISLNKLIGLSELYEVPLQEMMEGI